MAVQHITTTREVEEFVALLRSPTRQTPVVAISTHIRGDTPLIDAERIASAVGSSALVFVIKTGHLTYMFGDLMVDGAHVYGGAGRVYQPGVAWEEDLRRSPLRFAYDSTGGAASTDRLIDDASIPRGLATSPVKRTNSAFTDEQIALLAKMVASTHALVPARTSPPKPTMSERVRLAMTKPVEEITELAPLTVTPKPTSPAPVQAVPAAAEPAPGLPRLTGLAAVVAHTQPIPVIEPAVAAETGRKTGALNDALLRITALSSANTMLRAEVTAQRAEAIRDCANQMSSVAVENASLVRQIAELKVKQAEQLTTLRKKAGKAETAVSDYQPELFPTEEDAVRHAVYLAWVDRVPSTDKATVLLPEFAVGAEFAGSLQKLSAGQLTKAMKCVVDVLCGLARDSRGIHPLRGSVSTDVGGISRADGAVCHRASVEQKSASARRLHFWKLPDGSIELSRVVTHEDMKP